MKKLWQNIKIITYNNEKSLNNDTILSWNNKTLYETCYIKRNGVLILKYEILGENKMLTENDLLIEIMRY